MAEARWIHPSAEIEPGARIGAGTKIWRHAHVREGAIVGQGCTIAARVFVDSGVRIGHGVKIQDNVSVYTGVEIDDDVLVGPGAVFTNDLYPRASGEWRVTPTRVRRGASIGANATIVCGIEIGEGALVGAGAVVTHDVAPFELVGGNPARRLGWVCACGRVLVRTRGPYPSTWTCAHCSRASGEGEPSPVRLHQVELAPGAEKLVLDVLRSGHLAQGPMVERFEQAWAERVGVRHGVAVSSGTSALLLALQGCGVGPGDEVVTTAMTFVATLNAILATGAEARIVDIGEDGTLDPDQLDGALSDRTRAVLPVHLYGFPADMPRIAEAAAERDLAVLEDAAQAAGARIGDVPVGSYGVGCFSFYATKNLTTAEGGMITTDDAEMARRLRMLRDHGRDPEGNHVVTALNHRMTDVQAALGLADLETLDERNERRRQNAALLTDGLADVPGVEPLHPRPGCTATYSLYPVRVTDGARLGRDALADYLAQHGVESGVYYGRMVHDHAAFRGRTDVHAGPVARARALADEVLSLPVHPSLAEANLARIVDLVRAALT